MKKRNSLFWILAPCLLACLLSGCSLRKPPVDMKVEEGEEGKKDEPLKPQKPAVLQYTEDGISYSFRTQEKT